MKMLREKLKKNSGAAVAKMVPVIQHMTLTLPLGIEPDTSVCSYQGSIEKEYFMRDVLDLSENLSHALAINLEDYGYRDDHVLRHALNDTGTGKLRLRLRDHQLRSLNVEIEGTINASSFDFGASHDAAVVLNVIGIKQGSILSLFQQLLVEAYALSAEENPGMAFFTYFSAMEALATDSLEMVRNSTISELHDALERLSLDEKIRVAVKDKLGIEDLQKIPAWGEFMGLVKNVKAKRNSFAHGKNPLITEDDVVDALMATAMLASMVSQGHKTFDAMRKYLFA